MSKKPLSELSRDNIVRICQKCDPEFVSFITRCYRIEPYWISSACIGNNLSVLRYLLANAPQDLLTIEYLQSYANVCTRYGHTEAKNEIITAGVQIHGQNILAFSKPIIKVPTHGEARSSTA